ncbi:MAG TPA: cbb3-type cytochrome c oxidase subunit I, partial [Minicystis sp.]|nr:cbb3-type cytochrome c oxidase subunit I [Minicystis sp.]
MTARGVTEGEAPAPPLAPSYLVADRGIRSWLFTTDHKRIGLMFYVMVVLMLGLGGAFALVLRIELLTPNHTFIDALTYNRMFTLHGVSMVWLFMIPSIPNVFGNFFLPIMIGAKDLAFPRLNLASFYVYMLGAGIVLGGMVAGGADTGWTFYAPYSSTSQTSIVPVVFGIFVLGVSTIMTSVNFIVTVHTMRARGIGWFRLPLFVWAIYATAIIMLLATPVLGLSVILIGLDHIYRFGIFDPALGGD